MSRAYRVLIVVSIALLGLAAFSQSNDAPQSSRSETSSAECTEPENPWAGDDGGHDAGFRWAQESGESCPDDHGESFEEGCNEYYEQLNRFEVCEAAKRN